MIGDIGTVLYWIACIFLALIVLLLVIWVVGIVLAGIGNIGTTLAKLYCLGQERGRRWDEEAAKEKRKEEQPRQWEEKRRQEKARRQGGQGP
jgi:hypothetical protein